MTETLRDQYIPRQRDTYGTHAMSSTTDKSTFLVLPPEGDFSFKTNVWDHCS